MSVEEDMATVEFWLAPGNAKVLEQLSERQPELIAFVNKFKQMADEKLTQKAEQTGRRQRHDYGRV